MSFEEQVVLPVRKHLRRSVRLPLVGRWDIGTERGAPTLSLTLDAAVLGQNLQTNRAAAPFFLLCFAYWYERVSGSSPRLRLEVVGDLPERKLALRHARRAWIALEALQSALGDRLEVIGAPAARWPARPVFNAPQIDRGEADGRGGGREHKVEVALSRDASASSDFSSRFAPITGFRRQLPLGLFDETVSRESHWTPGQGAQADLWSTSPDGELFHLFELKVGGNAQVGVLPELLVYAWLLQRARSGLPGEAPALGGGPGVEAARRAKRTAAWILAPGIHPLVLHGGRGPLEWLNEGLRPELELRAVFFREGGEAGFGGWLPSAP